METKNWEQVLFLPQRVNRLLEERSKNLGPGTRGDSS